METKYDPSGDYNRIMRVIVGVAFVLMSGIRVVLKLPQLAHTHKRSETHLTWQALELEQERPVICWIHGLDTCDQMGLAQVLARLHHVMNVFEYTRLSLKT